MMAYAGSLERVLDFQLKTINQNARDVPLKI